MRSFALLVLLLAGLIRAQVPLPRFDRALHEKLATVEGEVLNGSYGRAARAAKKLLKDRDAQVKADATHALEVIEAYGAATAKHADAALQPLSLAEQYAQLLVWKHQFEGLAFSKDVRVRLSRLLAKSETRKKIALTHWRKQWREFESLLRDEVRRGAKPARLKKVRAAYRKFRIAHHNSYPADGAKLRIDWIDGLEQRSRTLQAKPAKPIAKAPDKSKQPAAKPVPLPKNPGAGLVFRLVFAGQAVTLGKLLAQDAKAVARRDHNGSTPLHIACQFRQLECAKVLLEHGADVDEASRGRWSPLHTAAFHGAAEVARFLIAKQATVDARQIERFTPLHFAVEQGHVGIARALLAAGADVNGLTVNLYTPLHIAALNKRPKCIAVLLAAKAKPELRGLDEKTPLEVAMEQNEHACMAHLIRAGAPVVANQDWQLTALHQAAMGGHIDGMQDALTKGVDINARAYGKMTALHLAVIYQRDAAVEWLVAKGADLEAQQAQLSTPLLLACHHGSLRTIEFLLKKGANKKARDKYGFGPMRAATRDNMPASRLLYRHGVPSDDLAAMRFTKLHLAAVVGDTELAKQALTDGVDLEAADIGGHRALALATACGHTEMMQLLIAKGSKIVLSRPFKEKASPLGVSMSAPGTAALQLLLEHGDELKSDPLRNAPLHFAAIAGDEDKIRFLVAKGENVNAANRQGATPLHEAIRARCYDAARVLLELGADPNQYSDTYGTPLMLLARDNRNQYPSAALALALIRAGAKVEAKTYTGTTAMHAAALRGHRKLGAVLLLAGASPDTENALHRTPRLEAQQRRDSVFLRMLDAYGR